MLQTFPRSRLYVMIFMQLFSITCFRFCITLWKSNYWVHKGLEDAYNRLIKPWLSRKVRTDLSTEAHKEGLKIFTSNLEKYLLTEPVKNRRIAGLDPGFKAGCKVCIEKYLLTAA